MKKIKFLDLQAQFLDLKNDILKGVEEVMKNAEFINGSALKEFENEFGDYIFNDQVEENLDDMNQVIDSLLHENCKKSRCVCVNSGTDALEIALKALDLPSGSEVLIQANTYFSVVESIINANLNVCIADCQIDGSFKPLDSMINENTKVLIATHLYGEMTDMDYFLEFANKHNLVLIEDASQSHGLKDAKNRMAGSIGKINIFSFYPGKNLGAYGDGGAIVSNDLELLNKARIIANHGQKLLDSNFVKNEHILIGRNSRLDSIQAKILSIKLKSLDYHNAHRMRCARAYNEAFNSLDSSLITLPSLEKESVWYLYVICLDSRIDRNLFVKRLNGLDSNDLSIECGIHYPKALSEFDFLKLDSRVRILESSNAENRAKSIVSLPIGEHITQSEIELIAKSVIEIAKDLAR